MSTSATPQQTRYEHLESRPGSFYRELFVRGLNLRASRLVAWLEAEGFTPEQAANDRGLPVEAVCEAIDYVQRNGQLIAEELERERTVLRDRGLLEAGDA
jgi:uncharacterized protein (DUF433 family)